MGNTRIQDANTGHIMGLREGFIPIGMKEHGGVIYIASVNKKGEGEIGTIPSPIIRDFLKESTTMKIDPTAITTADKGTGNDYVRISNKFYPGEKFLMALDLRNGDKKNACSALETQNCCYKYDSDSFEEVTVNYPLIDGYEFPTQYEYIGDSKPLVKRILNSNKGVYKIVLFSQSPSGIIRAGDRLMLPQTYYGKDGTVKSYPQWFMDYTEDTTLNPDLRLMNRGDGLKSYPSTSLPGYLCIKAELNSKEITKFEILKRSSGGLKVPGTVKVYSSNKDYKFYTYFPGFWYETNSFSYINKMEISVYNESSGEYLDLVKTSNDTDQYGHMLLAAPSKKITINIDNDANGGIAEKPTKLLYVKTTDKDDKFVYNGEYYFEPTPVYNYIILPDKKEEIKADPRTFCITNRGDFVNTWITDGFTYLKGQSVVTSNVVSSAPAFYGGLFHIDFGQNCNQWCKLEITFYNQYDDQIGVYTCKFNPYLNDTFGTNDIPEVEKAAFVDMVKTFKTASSSGLIGKIDHVVHDAGKQIFIKAADGISKWWISKDKTQQIAKKQGTLNLSTTSFGKTKTLSESLSNQLYTQYSGESQCSFSYYFYLSNIYVCSAAYQPNGDSLKYVDGTYTINNAPSGYNVIVDTKSVATNPGTQAKYYTVQMNTKGQNVTVNFCNKSFSATYSSSTQTVPIYTYDIKNKKITLYGTDPNKDLKYYSFASFNSTNPIIVQDDFKLNINNRSKTSYSELKQVYQNADNFKVTYTGVPEIWDNGDEVTRSLSDISIAQNTNTQRCLPFYLKVAFSTNVYFNKAQGTYKSAKKILPYVKHRMNFEDIGEVKDVGKLYTSEENWRKATNINWKRGANLEQVDYTESDRITSWSEQRYKKRDPNESISFTLSPNSIYVINFSGKCFSMFYFTYKGNIIYASKFVSSKSNYYFCPIVIVTGDESTTIDFTNETNAYITDYACGKVIDDNNSRYYKSLTSDGGLTITEGWYRLDYFNSLICQYNAKLTEQKTDGSTQTTGSEKKPIDPIILPLASCYRESYFSNNSGESAFYMNDITFQDTHTKYATYFPPAEYMCYTFDKYQGLDNTGDNQTQTEWYYQADITSLNQNSSNTEQLENAAIRIVPGSSLKVSATNTSIFGNSNNLFNRIWQ